MEAHGVGLPEQAGQPRDGIDAIIVLAPVRTVHHDVDRLGVGVVAYLKREVKGLIGSGGSVKALVETAAPAQRRELQNAVGDVLGGTAERPAVGAIGKVAVCQEIRGLV